MRRTFQAKGTKGRVGNVLAHCMSSYEAVWRDIVTRGRVEGDECRELLGAGGEGWGVDRSHRAL